MQLLSIWRWLAGFRFCPLLWEVELLNARHIGSSAMDLKTYWTNSRIFEKKNDPMTKCDQSCGPKLVFFLFRKWYSMIYSSQFLGVCSLILYFMVILMLALLTYTPKNGPPEFVNLYEWVGITCGCDMLRRNSSRLKKSVLSWCGNGVKMGLFIYACRDDG